MALSSREENNRQFQKGVIRAETFERDYPYAKTYEEPMDTPGASSFTERPRINAVKTIKVEMEQSEEAAYEKTGLTVLPSMELSVAVQWLLGKRTQCAKKNHQPPKQESQIKAFKIQESESSDEFEFVSNNDTEHEESQVEDEKQKIKKQTRI